MKKRKRGTRSPGSKAQATFLRNLPRTMPALVRAQRITERASKLGFDWPKVEPVWEKVEEELRELKAAVASGTQHRMREELGDLLFSLVNLSRFLNLEAEEALSLSIERFRKRFDHIKTRLRERGTSPDKSSLEQMDALWEEAKRMERDR